MSVFRQSAVILILGWALVPVQFLTSAAVARAVGPEGRGILFLLAGVTAVLVILSSFGLGSAAAVLHRKKTHPPGEILGSVLVVVLGSGAGLAAMYLWLSDAFLLFFVGELETVTVDRVWLALALAVVPVTVLLELGDVLLINEDEMRMYALRTTGTQLLAVVLTWGLIATGRAGITTILVAQALPLAFGLVVFVWWFVGKYGVRSVRCTTPALRDLFRIGLQQLGVSVVAVVGKRADAFIIARLLSLQEAGYFAVANTIQNLFVNIPRSALWPLVSTLSGDAPDRHKVLARATRVLTLVMALASLAFIAISPFFVRLVFGESFAPATIPVCLAMLGVVTTPVALGASALFTSQGRPARLMIAGIPGTAVRLALSFALVPALGASGSAIALSANAFTIAVVQLLQIRADGAVAMRELLVPTRSDLSLLRGSLLSRLRRGRAEPERTRPGSSSDSVRKVRGHDRLVRATEHLLAQDVAHDRDLCRQHLDHRMVPEAAKRRIEELVVHEARTVQASGEFPAGGQADVLGVIGARGVGDDVLHRVLAPQDGAHPFVQQ